MHVIFNPQDTRLLIYSQKGGYYYGSRFQRGYGIGSILKSIGRFIAPYAIQGLKSVVPYGVEASTRLLENINSGDNLKTALRKESARAGSKALSKLSEKVGQYGQGRKKKNAVKKKKKKQERKSKVPVKKKKSLIGRSVPAISLKKKNKYSDIFS